MIKWYRDLYLDDKASKKEKKFRKCVESTKILKRHCTVIALASNEDNLFDIFDTKELYFRYNRIRELYVVGLAANYESALELLQTMLCDMMDKEQSFSPRLFFARDKFD